VSSHAQGPLKKLGWLAATWLRDWRKAAVLLEYLASDRFSTQPMMIVVTEHDWTVNVQRFLKFTHHRMEVRSLAQIECGDYPEGALVLPIGIENCEALAASGSHFTMATSKAAFDLCNQKTRLEHALRQSAFTRFLPPQDGYPAILKPSVGHSSEGCRILGSPGEITADEARGLASGALLKQAFIPGDKSYAAHVLMLGQRAVFHQTVGYTFKTQMPIQGNDKPHSTQPVREAFLNVWEALLRHIGYNGFCCIDYKIPQNQPVLMEINPRIGYSGCHYLFGSLRAIQRHVPMGMAA
jgi:hypothetical protein